MQDEQALRAEWLNVPHTGLSLHCEKCHTYRAECECAYQEWKASKASGLERAPRAKSWALIRETHKRVRAIDWPALVERITREFQAAAELGESYIVLTDDLLKGEATPDAICERMRAEYPDAAFDWKQLSKSGVLILEWR